MDATERNVAIVKALGLDPTQIRKGGVTIHLDGVLGPVVDVKYRAMGENVVNAFEGAVARFKLVPIEEDQNAEP